MSLGRRPDPFDNPDYLFELKYDGFRALAVIEYGRCRFISRNGNTFSSFSPLANRIGAAFRQVRQFWMAKLFASMTKAGHSSRICSSIVESLPSLPST
jgi:hypothetical protein